MSSPEGFSFSQIFEKCEPDAFLEISYVNETSNQTEIFNYPLSCTEQFYGNYNLSLAPGYASKWFENRSFGVPVHYLILVVLGQIITVSSAFGNRRKNLWQDILNGRPSMPRYGDLVLGTENRKFYICLHMMMCETLYLILFARTEVIMPYSGSWSWYLYAGSGYLGSTVVFRIVAVIFYFFFYSPLFIGIAHTTLFNMTFCWLWLTYFLALVCIDLHYVTPWFKVVNGFVPEQIFMVRFPTILAGSILWCLVSYGILSRIRNITENFKSKSLFYKFFKYQLMREPLTKLFDSDEVEGENGTGNYSEYMKQSPYYQEVDGILNPIRSEENFRNFYWQFLRKIGYKPKYGFQFPTRVLCGLACTVVLLYDGVTVICWSFAPTLRDWLADSTTYIETARGIAPVLIQTGVVSNNSFFANPDKVAQYGRAAAVAAFSCFIIALVFAITNAFIGILFHLRTFRFHLRRVRRGYRADIPTDKIASFSAISAGMKYGAYVCSYPIWGGFFQWFLAFLILYLATLIFIIPIFIEGSNAWLVQFMKRSWYGWLYTIIIILTQRILSTFVFSIDRTVVREKGKYDRGIVQGHILITNRYLYDMLSLFFWFNYIFIGFVSLLLRVVFTIGMALLFIGRLDQPSVQRNFETLDSGYNTYLGYQAFIEGNTHPILLTSLQFFLAGPAGKRYRDRKHREEEEREARMSSSTVDPLDEEKSKNQNQKTQKPNVGLMQNSYYRAQWRWQFAYTMVRNQSLVVIRSSTQHKLKIKMKMLEEQEKNKKIEEKME